MRVLFWSGSNTHNNGQPAGDGQAGDAGEGNAGECGSQLRELDKKQTLSQDFRQPTLQFC